jgi:hypothetical protein
LPVPAPPTEDLRVARYAPGWGYAAREWQAALGAIDWDAPDHAGGPRRLKTRDGDCTVWLAALTLPGRAATVVLKVDPLPNWWEVFRSWLGLTRAHRQWRGARLLQSRGFHAAGGLALLRGTTGGTIAELLVLEALPGKTVLQHLADDDLSVGQQHALARALGRHAAKLLRAGLINRDAKPSNLVVSWHGDTPAIAVVDTVAVRKLLMPRSGRTESPLSRMLRDFLLEPLGTGPPPRRTLMRRTLRATTDTTGRAWKKHRDAHWNRVAALIAAHGDPTPRDQPLTRERSQRPEQSSMTD